MRSIKFLAALLIGCAMFLASMQSNTVNSQTSVTGSQAYPGNYTSTAIYFKVIFSSDSLLNAKTNLFAIGNYNVGSFSWKASGTVKNFRINAYKTNFNNADTTFWTLVNQWDTTGNYTGKPVIDSVDNALITGTAGLPMRYLAFQVKGLAGNREDVILEIALDVYRKPQS